MRIIGRLDVKNGHLVKTINLEGLRQIGSCKDFALKYMRENIDEIFLSDPVASLYDREPLFKLLDDITDDLFIPITISGGIKNIEDIRKLLLIGADKIAMNTAAIVNPELIDEAVSIFGSQSIAVSIQAKKINDEWYCFTNCGRDKSNKTLHQWLKEVEKRGAGELIITSVSKEGMKKGLDLELIKIVSKNVNLPITYSGGLGNINHLDPLKDLDLKLNGLAIAGSLHYNNLKIDEIRKKLLEINIPVRSL